MTTAQEAEALRAYVSEWVVKAERDLALARHEQRLPARERITEGICFHCQQSVEKHLKAFCAGHGIDFEKSHNLEYLRELCASVDASFAGLDLGTLTSYAVGLRYPGSAALPTTDEADTALTVAEKCAAFVAARLASMPH